MMFGIPGARPQTSLRAECLRAAANMPTQKPKALYAMDRKKPHDIMGLDSPAHKSICLVSRGVGKPDPSANMGLL